MDKTRKGRIVRVATAVWAGLGVLAAVGGPQPSAALVARIADEQADVIGIVHWGLNTFTDREWGSGGEDPQLLAPTDFSADQIVGACKAGGIGGLVVVAKHHDGFCLWPTKTTDHNISKSPFRGGKGDYVGEMCAACRKAGLRFGVYCSPWDRNNAGYATEAYVKTYHAQVAELLDGRYGEIFEMWFDGANGGSGWYGGANETRRIGDGYYRFDELFRTVRRLQPKACIFGMGGEFAWPGNERGYVPDDRSPSDAKVLRLWEADFPLRKGWFYHQADTNTVRCGEFLMQRYLGTVGKGAIMDIGIAPDRRGRLADEDVAALRRFGELRRAFFAHEVTDDGPFNLVVARDGLGLKRMTVTTDRSVAGRRYRVEARLLNRVMNATVDL